jgi:hypothetical protein
MMNFQEFMNRFRGKEVDILKFRMQDIIKTEAKKQPASVVTSPKGNTASTTSGSERVLSPKERFL